jgi:hypothetical protein
MRYGQMKNRLKIETVKALTTVKISCPEFFSQISKERVFLEEVHNSDKYSGDSGKAFAESDLHFIFL